MSAVLPPSGLVFVRPGKCSRGVGRRPNAQPAEVGHNPVTFDHPSSVPLVFRVRLVQVTEFAKLCWRSMNKNKNQTTHELVEFFIQIHLTSTKGKPFRNGAQTFGTSIPSPFALPPRGHHTSSSSSRPSPRHSRAATTVGGAHATRTFAHPRPPHQFSGSEFTRVGRAISPNRAGRLCMGRGGEVD